MASELQLSNTQVAAGPLVLDGETLTGIVVTTGYVFSSSHNLAAVTPYEVTPASEESRLAATAATILDEAETGWYVTVAGSTALDLSDVANRGGIAWFRPNNDYIGFSEDIGGTNAAYLPTWPDGLFFDRIGSYDDLIGRTVAGVAFDVTGNVPTADLATAVLPAWGDWSDPLLPLTGTDGWIDGTATGFDSLRWRMRSDGLVELGGSAGYYVAGDLAPPPIDVDSAGWSTIVETLPVEIRPPAGFRFVHGMTVVIADPVAAVPAQPLVGTGLAVVMGSPDASVVILGGDYWVS